MPVPVSRYQVPLSALTSIRAAFQVELLLVRAAVVAARGEHGPRRGDPAKRFDGVLQAADAGRVLPRPDQDEVVVHEVEALHAEAVGDELFLGSLVMDEQDVGIAIARQLDGLAGADGDDPHRNSGLLRELRQDVVVKPGVLGRGGGGHRDEGLGRRGRSAGKAQGEQGRQQHRGQ